MSVPIPTDGIIRRDDDQSPVAFLSVGRGCHPEKPSYLIPPPRLAGEIDLLFNSIIIQPQYTSNMSKALAVIAGVGPGTVRFHIFQLSPVDPSSFPV